MLILCPECNKQISDKAEKCIHCGYPIRNTPYIHEEILGVDYDVSFLLDKSVSLVNKIKQLKELTGCDLFLAKKIALKYNPTESKAQETSNQIKCPTCSSTNISQISTTAKMVNVAIFGLLGNKRKKMFHCNSCKYEW